MTNEKSLSPIQAAAVLDNAPIAVYVSALDTNELLYANKLAVKMFFRQDMPGGLCYQALGNTEPCSFCQVGKMGREAFLTREYCHPDNGHVYQLSGKLLDWEGQAAHIEYMVDVTDKRKEEDRQTALREELQTTFSSIPCGLCVYRYEQGTIVPVFHNSAFYGIMGYTDEEICRIEQKTEFLGVHPEDSETLKNKIFDAIRINGGFCHTYRVFNSREDGYRWIRLEGAVKPQKDGTKLLYGVYSNVSEQVRLEKELAKINEKMQSVINAIPGGVAIYKMSDIFETVYFSDGVPELSGYTVEEYHELVKSDAAEMTYPEDTERVVESVKRAVENGEAVDLEFRKNHRNGNIVWVHMQARQIGTEDGCPLIQCVFHNITALKEAQLEMNHLVNSIPGGIAIYQVEDMMFKVVFFSDGVMGISGHTREEYELLVQNNAMDLISELDRDRVAAAARTAVETGNILDISYRIRHKDGRLIWIHLNGRRMGPLSKNMRFYAVFTGMSAETRLFQSIADDAADGVYVIDKTNYDLLYANESFPLFKGGRECVGEKCYEVLQGGCAPCQFCTLKSHAPDGIEHEIRIEKTGRILSTKFREMDWNGIPSYVKYIRDVTAEYKEREEKERLEQYFQTVVKNLPGGIAVIRSEKDGSLVPEFISGGLAAMLGLAEEEAWNLCMSSTVNSIHPDDIRYVVTQMREQAIEGTSNREIVYRLIKKDGSFLWVKNTLSLFHGGNEAAKIYAVFHDITNEMEERQRIRTQYKELLLQHYQTPDPNALIIGHSNITQNRVIELNDYLGLNLSEKARTDRDAFVFAVSGVVQDDGERRDLLERFSKKRILEDFRRGEQEQKMQCFVKLSREPEGRYVQFKVNLVETPDTGEVTEVFKISDVTESEIERRIMRCLSVSGYDFASNVNLKKDSYRIVGRDENSGDLRDNTGSHQARINFAADYLVVPRDREYYLHEMDPEYMLKRLKKDGTYSFSFSITDENGEIRTKRMTVSAIDLRLGRVCLTRSDITESVREQQGLLNMIAYTFDLAGFLNVTTGRLVLHTRKTVLGNLPPYLVEDYDKSVGRFTEKYGVAEEKEGVRRQFQTEEILERLKEKTGGYDFIFSFMENGTLRYKQINVLWGDENHRTVCLVRADVTDMLMEERHKKKELEEALVLAKEASRAKSSFLSSMSHDIRTPMNAIMGMTTLAKASIDDRGRVEDCLDKIMISSRHLLSLINDVLDMSKIEHSKITLNNTKISIYQVTEGITAILEPQARLEGLHFNCRLVGIVHRWFYGDGLRINQILINVIGNSIKFTPKGGEVTLQIEETKPLNDGERVRYRFIISDTGIGMPKEFLEHIFEPFIRNQDSMADRIEGTGLGLSITKGLVEMMNGAISVESQVGKGTTFIVELELESAGEEPELEKEYCAEHGLKEAGQDAGKMIGQNGEKERDVFAGRRFLVAEDNQINAEIVTQLLTLYGAGAVVRPDGKKVVEEFEKSVPGMYDAILMDIQMPGMNGYEAASAIRGLARPDAGTIPIIAMTANAFTEDVQAALAAGMNAHVAKPVDMEVLQETLRKVL